MADSLLMRSRSFVLLSAVILTATCTYSWRLPPETQHNVETYSDPEAYAVYSALLSSNGTTVKPSAQYLVIQQQTTAAESQGCLPDGKEFRGSWEDVLKDYLDRNQSPRVLSRSFWIDRPYKLITRGELSDAFRGEASRGLKSSASLSDRWKNYYRRFPSSPGYTVLSAVGFNGERTEALVYIAVHCGPLCGTGRYVFFVKRDGKWLRADLKASTCNWIS